MVNDLDPKAAGAKRFAGKVCIVTGAGQGIGRATARRLAAEGGRIAVVERVEASALETARQLSEAGADVMTLVIDVSKLPDVQKLMHQVADAWGQIDVLVNIVGGTIWWQPYHAYSHEQIDHELERSLYTALWGCHAVLPFMLARNSGAIVNLSSIVTRGGLHRGPYAISKGGIDALTKVLANEYGPHGIRVNAVSPGSTGAPDRVTPRLSLRPGVIAEPNEGMQAYFEEARGNPESLALRRQGTTAEQAAVIAFLASDDASYVTGQIITCAGDP